MNILFLSISSLPNLNEHSISLDLLHEFQKKGNNVYVVSALDDKENKNTSISKEAGCISLRVKIGKNKKANIIEKGLTTIFLPRRYIYAINKCFSNIKFDLVIYPTPPITHVDTVQYIKKRDGAKSYLLLKDIFPQNAVDLGMMSKAGVVGLVYRYFRSKEKKLYEISDRIGCMSRANVDYILKNNPEIDTSKVEVCPNSIEVQNSLLSKNEKDAIRKKYGIPQNKKIFVYGGNLGKPQGIPFIMDCLKTEIDNNNVFFIIIGDGTEYSRLETFISDTKPTNVKLMKRLPKDDYDMLVTSCDIGMIFLDYRFTIPNFPSRLLSYMQAGLPVIACTDQNSDIGKIIEDGGFGWWSYSNDVQSFKKVVSKAIDSDLDELGKRAYDYLKKNYTSLSAVETILNSYEKINKIEI